MQRVAFIPWDSRRKGFTPEMFRTTRVYRYGGSEEWHVESEGKEKIIRTPKEWTSKKQHYYAYVPMIVEDKIMTHRSMSLAALIWLCYLGRAIPPGYVVDHIDENPSNNEPDNLQLLSVGDNTRKTYKLKKK